MKIDVELKGIDEAVKKFKRYSEAKKQGVITVIDNTSEAIKQSQLSKVPVESGDTKESIKVEKIEGGLGATIGPRLPKGFKRHWIEFGTSHHPPQPFIFPSFEENKQGYLNSIKKELGKR